MSLKKVKRAVSKRLANEGIRVMAMSELPVIGKIDDPDGFFDDVKENADDIKMHYTAYVTAAVTSKLANKINEQIAYLGAEIEFKLEKSYGIHK